MTDEQIIKALECCIDNDRLKSCKKMGCPLAKHCRKDTDALERECLDLIRQQKARIERLEFLEEMRRLQLNADSIEKEKMLNEIKKDFGLFVKNLVKEMVGE